MYGSNLMAHCVTAVSWKCLLGVLLTVLALRASGVTCAKLPAIQSQFWQPKVFQEEAWGTVRTAPWETVGPKPWQNTVAICATMRDEHPEDIRQWLRYHRWLGVDKVFLSDNNKEGDALAPIRDYVTSGFIVPSRSHQERPQRGVYQHCIDQYASEYSWIAFLDLDEFIVVRDKEAATLKSVLKDYRFFGGLSINWVLFGSNGFQKRPKGGGMLQHYTSCSAKAEPTVKTIANSYFVESTTPHPHNFFFKSGMTSVNERRYPLELYCFNSSLQKGPCLSNDGNKLPESIVRNAAHRSVDRIAVFHYATKSKADFEVKAARGGANGAGKTIGWFRSIQRRATSDDGICKEGLSLYAACCQEFAEADTAMAALTS